MARRRRDKSPSGLKLKQPDRNGPSEQTLLDLAEKRGLFNKAQEREESIKAKTRAPESSRDDTEPMPPVVERIFETLLWTVSLSTLHFTLDVLVQNQYAAEISWPKIIGRAGQAFLVFGLLFYTLHAHASNPTILPGLPARYQPILRQSIFFVTSICAGCYLIHISNTYSYLAVMKQAPPVGCLWIWAVIELDLPWAALSLAGAAAFLWQGGYDIK
ncbi:hypothetical protein CONLIGDRAFT_650215 [Coniochaeta ligniaria NRRL 30616]|uniref:DUF7719 domain-containing protein n=1 Tax=Coniochaeta ligniaria NRRL 30616 TaxID=1408157 RepID=A0A1J7I5P6_9PEZI|nr:hypothetical protein CONLIGDRAFT_650215 [Coniochaeta ligniaria NRRL 30616]